jgi:glucose-1-phosphate cytidylyltransferase
MKVVLFCGGLGQRLRDQSDGVPKPMVPIGYRPILWHVMKYYAHFGHKDFILCLGYKADLIKNYFVNYNEYVSNDFILTGGKQNIALLNSDIHDWKITFCDTGLHSNIGMRLKAVEEHLKSEEMFLANYSDGVTDLYLPHYIDAFQKSGKIGSFLCVKPNHSFHVVQLAQNGLVSSIRDLSASEIQINGGFFAFRREIFQYLRQGEELVHEPFQRLIERGELTAYEHRGFWACMDTFKDKQLLDELWASGNPPWELWKKDRAGTSPEGRL